MRLCHFLRPRLDFKHRIKPAFSPPADEKGTFHRGGGRYPLFYLAGIGASIFLSGCANQTVQPNFFVWQSGIETGSVEPQPNASSAGWGLYSGARGQTRAPEPITYVYRGAGSGSAIASGAQ